MAEARILTKEEIAEMKKAAKQVGNTLKKIHAGDHISDNEMLQFIGVVESVTIILGELGREYWLPYIELDKTVHAQKGYAKNRGIIPN